MSNAEISDQDDESSNSSEGEEFQLEAGDGSDYFDCEADNSSHEAITKYSQRERKLPAKFKEYVSHLCNYYTDPEPKTITEARSSKNAAEWETIAKEEVNSLIKNNTLELTDLPLDRKTVGCKWVFKKKKAEDGSVVRYKARLVAQGFSQVEGLDFEETYAPVSKLPTIKTLSAYAVNKNLFIHQMDVTAAYLNGKLEEEIYMKQPPGFEVSEQTYKALRLKKSIYGLKQSGINC